MLENIINTHNHIHTITMRSSQNKDAENFVQIFHMKVNCRRKRQTLCLNDLEENCQCSVLWKKYNCLTIASIDNFIISFGLGKIWIHFRRKLIKLSQACKTVLPETLNSIYTFDFNCQNRFGSVIE